MGRTDARLDELDRRIVAALQMDGRASWTAIAEQVGTSVPTVARRAQQLMAEDIVRVAVVPDINHAGPADLFILSITCDPGMASEVAEKLGAREDIRFLALVTGGADIVAELNTRKSESLQARLIDEVQAIDGVRRCETDLVFHQYKVAHDWSRQLLTGEDYVAPTDDPHPCDPRHFDETDRAMLALMQDDGRAGFRSVAELLGINESTVRRRFETLLARGCITVVTLVPAAALGFESELLFVITVAPNRLDAVARRLVTYRGVRYVAATLGSSSLMCEVILPTTRDLFGFVTTVLAELDGVQGWTAGMELMTYKRGFVRTVPERCEDERAREGTTSTG
ncbi:MAG: Lrp/AsnC family transcriptional regulator [Actinomycetes bacterium]